MKDVKTPHYIIAGLLLVIIIIIVWPDSGDSTEAGADFPSHWDYTPSAPQPYEPAEDPRPKWNEEQRQRSQEFNDAQQQKFEEDSEKQKQDSQDFWDNYFDQD